MEIRGKNEYDHLILKYDQIKNTFADVTSSIIFLSENIQYYYVVFLYKEDKKDFKISKDKIKFSTNPQKIVFDNNELYINGKKNNNVTTIIKFDSLGYKIFFKDGTKLFVKNINIEDGKVIIDNLDLKVLHTGNIVFDYYKALAKCAKDMKMDESSIESLLNNLYLKVNKVDKECVLNGYTNGKLREISFDSNKLIYPFSTNLSQMSAIRKTFQNELSVISGPPGTGKTQVILNIICNAIYNNMKVAVISNNNTAVDNVYDKMKEEELEFFIAYLGNSDNVERFFSSEDDLKSNINKLNFEECNNNVSEFVEKLNKLFDCSNKVVKLRSQLFEIEQEFRHFTESNKYHDYSDYIEKYYNPDKYIEFKYYIISIKKLNIFNKLKLKYKFKLKKINISSIDDFIVFLDYQLYYLKIEKLKEEIKELEDYLNENKLSDLSEQLKSKSKNIFKEFLFDKYNKDNNCKLNKENYKENFEIFTNRYPVILSTTHSLLRNISYGFKFDLIIIDEASQSDILTTLLTMNVTKQMVIVGDPKQLSQIDNQEIYNASITLQEKYKVPEYYHYKENSILQSVISLPCNVETTILREHYRCDSRIIEFCNKKFYENELIVCTKTSENDPLFILHTVPGNHARANPHGTGQYNDREAQEIINILRKCNSDSIGIITPFRGQADYIKSLLKDEFPYVEVDTIHKYQGRQKKIIILSTVVNDLNYDKDSFITDFVTNKQLLNVAISRAIEKLYLVVSDKVYRSNSNTIAQFIDYIKYYCKEEASEEGKVTSVFDILYDGQYKKIKNSPCGKYVDSYAEEIIKRRLDELLKDYPEYKLVLHYTLKYLVTNFEGFSNEEIRYITNPRTHVDFVIFDKITYKPILCIEVDGTKYHDYSVRQIKNDKIKDRILEANEIKLLRLKTNHSGEMDKIKDYLKGV